MRIPSSTTVNVQGLPTVKKTTELGKITQLDINGLIYEPIIDPVGDKCRHTFEKKTIHKSIASLEGRVASLEDRFTSLEGNISVIEKILNENGKILSEIETEISNDKKARILNKEKKLQNKKKIRLDKIRMKLIQNTSYCERLNFIFFLFVLKDSHEPSLAHQKTIYFQRTGLNEKTLKDDYFFITLCFIRNFFQKIYSPKLGFIII